MKNVALIGASGFVGTAILNELLSRGHRVTAIVRDASRLTVKSDLLTIAGGDATQAGFLAEAVKGKDAVISAFCAGWTNPNMYEDTLRGYPLILEGVKRAGVGRMLLVGGAGVLYVKPGLRLVDTGTLPEAWMPGVKSQSEFYLGTLSKEKDLDWVYLAPAADLGHMTAGTRTGKYRTGTDSLLTDDRGDSFISVEDYAVAMVDELEQEHHHRELFTVAY